MQKGKQAFSLIELLTVMVIIALLLGLLMPALGRAKEEARKTQCRSNLRQIGMAMQLYVTDNRDWTPVVYGYYATPEATRLGLPDPYILNPDAAEGGFMGIFYMIPKFDVYIEDARAGGWDLLGFRDNDGWVTHETYLDDAWDNLVYYKDYEEFYRNYNRKYRPYVRPEDRRVGKEWRSRGAPYH